MCWRAWEAGQHQLAAHRPKAGYTLKQLLNSGTYGCVFLAHSTRANCHVALKCIMKRRFGEPAAEGQKAGPKADMFLEKYLPRELELVTSLSHPNIIRYYEAIDEDLHALISMEYVGNGMLLDYLNHMGTECTVLIIGY